MEQEKLDKAKDLVDRNVAEAKDIVDAKLDAITARLDAQHEDIRETNKLLVSMARLLERLKTYFTKNERF